MENIVQRDAHLYTNIVWKDHVWMDYHEAFSFSNLLFRCPVHFPHLPPGEPSRLPAGDGERKLLSAPLETDRLYAAAAAQRRPFWELHGTDPLPLRLLCVLWGVQHHFFRWALWHRVGCLTLTVIVIVKVTGKSALVMFWFIQYKVGQFSWKMLLLTVRRVNIPLEGCLFVRLRFLWVSVVLCFPWRVIPFEPLIYHHIVSLPLLTAKKNFTSAAIGVLWAYSISIIKTCCVLLSIKNCKFFLNSVILGVISFQITHHLKSSKLRICEVITESWICCFCKIFWRVKNILSGANCCLHFKTLAA